MTIKYNWKLSRHITALPHVVGKWGVKRGNFLRGSFGGVTNFSPFISLFPWPPICWIYRSLDKLLLAGYVVEMLHICSAHCQKWCLPKSDVNSLLVNRKESVLITLASEHKPFRKRTRTRDLTPGKMRLVLCKVACSRHVTPFTGNCSQKETWQLGMPRVRAEGGGDIGKFRCGFWYSTVSSDSLKYSFIVLGCRPG